MEKENLTQIAENEDFFKEPLMLKKQSKAWKDVKDQTHQLNLPQMWVYRVI